MQVLLIFNFSLPYSPPLITPIYPPLHYHYFKKTCSSALILSSLSLILTMRFRTLLLQLNEFVDVWSELDEVILSYVLYCKRMNFCNICTNTR